MYDGPSNKAIPIIPAASKIEWMYMPKAKNTINKMMTIVNINPIDTLKPPSFPGLKMNYLKNLMLENMLLIFFTYSPTFLDEKSEFIQSLI